jgi:transcriptional regulator with XRE-family HTH domain
MSDTDTVTFGDQVGQRLRAIRRQRGLSLDEVERRSDGRWSASAIGSYERGFRNLSLPRLRDLALFYEVPMSALLGDSEPAPAGAAGRLVLDLVALGELEEAAPVARYASTIAAERGDWNGRVLSLRQDDARVLCSMLRLTEPELRGQLEGWGALAELKSRPPDDPVAGRS